jgi:NAD(P)-dependent dehydrogenase (short-subunit alcohol dehydrogenase family)
MKNPGTAVVTGTSGGIGAALAERLYADGWELITINRRQQPDLPRVRRLTADLGEPEQVAAAAAAIVSDGRHVDLLLNNAGVLLGAPAYNSSGLELHYAVNTLAPYLLLRDLRPALALPGSSLALTVSSTSMLFARQLDVAALRHPMSFRKLTGQYAHSKLAVSVTMQALAPEYEPDGILLRTVEPGSIKTSMTAGAGMPKALLPLRNLFFSTTNTAVTNVLAAAAPALGPNTGLFVVNGRVKKLPARALRPSIVDRLLAQLDYDAPPARPIDSSTGLPTP